MIDDEDAFIAEFLESLPPDRSKRPPNWRVRDRNRISIVFLPAASEKMGIGVAIHLSPAQADRVRQAAAAAGVEAGQWVRRHMLAAAGCLPPNSPDDTPALREIYEAAAYLDSLLATKQ